MFFTLYLICVNFFKMIFGFEFLLFFFFNISFFFYLCFLSVHPSSFILILFFPLFYSRCCISSFQLISVSSKIAPLRNSFILSFRHLFLFHYAIRSNFISIRSFQLTTSKIPNLPLSSNSMKFSAILLSDFVHFFLLQIVTIVSYSVLGASRDD